MYNKIYVNYDNCFLDFNESLEYGQPNELKFRNFRDNVGETADGEFLFLRSNGYIVFVYDIVAGEGYDISRIETKPTKTTVRQIYKFIDDYKIPAVYCFDKSDKGIYYQRVK